jgi:hypothetical protein
MQRFSPGSFDCLIALNTTGCAFLTLPEPTVNIRGGSGGRNRDRHTVFCIEQRRAIMKRRSILSLLGAAPALLAGSKLEAAQKAKQTHSTHASNVGDKITGLNPRGIPPAIKLLPMAPRLNTLDGKTVYLVSDGFPGADQFLNQVKIWFAKNMPSVKTIYRLKAGSFAADDPKLNAEVKANGNAVIMAIGH